VISGLERVSKPGRRIYAKKDEIPWVLSGIGVTIMSTPKGVMTDRKARKIGVGGEVLCKVW
jgi:small subunit ribosomal protein S8